jgi:hypothetical protein
MSPLQINAVKEIQRLAQTGYELSIPDYRTPRKNEILELFDSIRFQVEVILQN